MAARTRIYAAILMLSALFILVGAIDLGIKGDFIAGIGLTLVAAVSATASIELLIKPASK